MGSIRRRTASEHIFTGPKGTQLPPHVQMSQRNAASNAAGNSSGNEAVPDYNDPSSALERGQIPQIIPARDVDENDLAVPGLCTHPNALARQPGRQSKNKKKPRKPPKAPKSDKKSNKTPTVATPEGSDVLFEEFPEGVPRVERHIDTPPGGVSVDGKTAESFRARKMAGGVRVSHPRVAKDRHSYFNRDISDASVDATIGLLHSFAELKTILKGYKKKPKTKEIYAIYINDLKYDKEDGQLQADEEFLPQEKPWDWRMPEKFRYKRKDIEIPLNALRLRGRKILSAKLVGSS
jgi:hypothetical protein